MKGITPILLVLVAAGIFFWYVDPTYAHVRQLQAQASVYDEALNKSKELQTTRDKLLSRYNTFDEAQISRLTKLLPDAVDNVRLVIDLDGIASRYGMRVKNVSVDKGPASGTQTPGAVGPSTQDYGEVQISFAVSGSYDDFIAFLNDLEKSLRLVDVTGVSFQSTDKGTYDYAVTLHTYWLR